MPASPITPTIGRIVLFVLPANSKRAGEIRPANVVRVNDQGENPADHSLNLNICLDGPNDAGEASWAGSAKYDDNKTPGTWHWMPYQKAVAAGQTPPVQHA